MKDYEFKKRLAYATTLRHMGYFQRSSEILGTLADALLYASTYSKEKDDALCIVQTLCRRHGKEVASFLCNRVRDDREQALTCSIEELADFLSDRRQEEEKEEDKVQRLVAFIKSNKNIYNALQKNCSAQYLNRLLANTALQAKGAKLKKFYKLTKHLF